MQAAKVQRPRFRLPLPVEKIRVAPPPPSLVEMLETFTSMAPEGPEGPDIGTGVGPRVIEPVVLDGVGVEEVIGVDADLDVGDVAQQKKVAGLPPRRRAKTAVADAAADAAMADALAMGVKRPAVKEGALVLAPGAAAVAAAAAAAAPAVQSLQTRLEKLLAKNPTLVRSPFFVPSNRRKFKQFIIQSFRRYLLPKPSDIPNPDACAEAAAASRAEVKTFSYQSFVRDYIQRPSPYRGVLVYHGLGSGKTCTSIASLESLYTAGQRPVYIFTPASLSKNYRDEITKCGPFIFRTNNHWTWMPVPTLAAPTAEAELLIRVLGIPRSVVAKQKGGWAPDPAKAPNFDALSAAQRRQIQDQIASHIEERFIFVHYNGLLEKQVRNWACNTPTMFDGATVVIDEVHNLIRTINNSNLESFYKEEQRSLAQYMPRHCKTGRKYRISYLLYRMLCNAVGCKIIALSGTPIINYPQEIAILANMLSGDTRMVEATLPGFEARERVLAALERHAEVDFVEVLPRPQINASIVRVTPVPSGCRKVIDPETGAFRGFVRDAELREQAEEIARERDLEAWLARVLRETGVALQDAKFLSVPRLPDLEKPFRELFVDTEHLEIKDRLRLPLEARLSGLISFYKGGKADLMARVTTDEVVMLDMSDLQLKEYTAMRKEEIDKEQKAQKKKPVAGVQAAPGPTLYDQVTKGQTSTFKIFSRAACNFAFPKDMDRPRPADFREALVELGVGRDERSDELEREEGKEGAEVAAVLDAEESGTGVGVQGAVGVPTPEVADALVPRGFKMINGKLVKMSPYEMAIYDALAELRGRGEEVFGATALPTLSPKYQAMIDRMDRSRGTMLVYSQFKKLEGIGLFAMSLEVQKGYRRFDIEMSPAGWRLTEETRTAAGPGTPRYILYTGDETLEKRNILKAVFNAAWSKIPAALAAEVRDLTGAEHNRTGDIARVFMITQSGAEGISLANVRQVHIMEPYWNYVRLEQVKGRAIRICSHMDLPPEERTVEVFTYIARFSKEQLANRMVDETLMNFDAGETTDEGILRLSDAKKKLTDSLFRVMQESAVDCELNANENGALACYRFAGDPSMEPLFHPLTHVHVEDAEAAVRAR